MSYASNDEIRGVLIQAGNERVLLPNATVAEMMSRVPVQPVSDAPRGLVGEIALRHQHALGHAGRARGVEQVGRVLHVRCGLQRRHVDGALVEKVPQCLKALHRCGAGDQPAVQLQVTAG